MLSTVGQRLGALIRAKGYSVTSFAKKIRTRWHHLRDLIEGKAEMHKGDLEIISLVLDLNSNESCWLANPLIPGATPPDWLQVDDLEDTTVGDMPDATH